MKHHIIIYCLILSVTYICMPFEKAFACGPFYNEIPNPDFLILKSTSPDDNVSITALDNERENISLWASLTSDSINPEDIRNAVYKMSYSEFINEATSEISDSTNSFIATIIKNNDYDIVAFLSIAKHLEELRAEKRSEWHYPKNKTEDAPYQEIIDRCLAYSGGRLYDRYGLQAIRALFASKRYDDCIDFFNKYFADVPDNNLFKRMSLNYVAGANVHLGNTEEADLHFALSGDINSIKRDDAFAYMAGINPSAPALIQHIKESAGKCSAYNRKSADSLYVKSLLPTIKKINASEGNPNIADWLLAEAYIEGEFLCQPKEAIKALNSGLTNDKISLSAKENMEAYKILLTAREGDTKDILSDAKWIASHVVSGKKDYERWNDILCHIIWDYWVPQSLKKNDTTMAIRLSSFADYLLLERMGNKVTAYDNAISGVRDIPMSEIRTSSGLYNPKDYGCYTFHLMCALKPEQIEEYKNSLGDSWFDTVGRHDADYLNELIGTLYLRERNYKKAIELLSMVSPTYQYSLNTFNYLDRNPFTHKHERTETRWIHNDNNDFGKVQFRLSDICNSDTISPKNAKLTFAKEMNTLDSIIQSDSDINRRSLVKVQYAIGQLNSIDACWALTQYWKGWVSPMYDNDWYTDLDTQPAFTLYDRLISEARKDFTDPEYAAKAELLLNNYTEIARKYPATSTAKFLKANCDNYQDWL